MYGSRYVTTGGSRDVSVSDVDAGIAVGFVSPATARDARDGPLLVPRGHGALAARRGAGATSCCTPPGSCGATAGSSSPGPAGAGKSTLAMACARRGFGVFAEDAVFVRVRSTALELWGIPWVQRLLPDAAALLPGARRDSRSTPAAERRDQDRGGPRPGPAGAGRPVRDGGADPVAGEGHRRSDPDRAGGGRDRPRRARDPLAVGRWLVRAHERGPRSCWPAGASSGCT